MNTLQLSASQRAANRKASMQGNIAKNYKEAEEWDLLFWQKQSPQARLSALVAIHKDIENINHKTGEQT